MVAMTRFLTLLVAVSEAFPFSQIARDDSHFLLLNTAKRTEQERLEKIFNDCKRWPVAELERFDIDISTPIFVDTLRAEKFITALTKRQEELGMANEDVKIMAEIGLKLWENKQSVSECVESLQELERLFRTSFSKNVGDFYTIGGWPILLSMLDIDKKPEQQGYAALAIATAVEDNCDFQMMLLHNDSIHPRELTLKTNNRKDKNYYFVNDKSTSNKDDDINNDDNKNESIQKSMTGIEKLVSLLYHSTNNESFIMQNRPNLDELQVFVLYTISVAVGLNVDLQGALLKIAKSDVSVNKNGDINKNESSSVGGKVNIDQSVFMNYLIKIAEQGSRNNSNNNNNDIDNENSNKYDNNNHNDNDDNISYELTKQIWAFIAGMLRERAYIKLQFSLISDLPEKVKEEISTFVDIGEYFLTEFWFNLAGRTYEKILTLYNDIEKRPLVSTVATNLKYKTWLSIIENSLSVGYEIICQNETMKLKLRDELKTNSTAFLRMVFKQEER